MKRASGNSRNAKALIISQIVRSSRPTQIKNMTTPRGKK